MSDNREKKSTRRAKTDTAIERQKRIANQVGVGHTHEQPHRYAKRHATNCGDSSCAMCGNPRKFFNELTLQEKRFIQGSKIDTQNGCI